MSLFTVKTFQKFLKDNFNLKISLKYQKYDFFCQNGTLPDTKRKNTDDECRNINA